VGAVSVGWGPDGKRLRRKVRGKTKQEVRDKLRALMSAWARRAEDLTSGKTDDKDAVLITRLTAQLRCYRPEPADAIWARLRQLGIRRARLVAGQVAQVQQMRDLPGCAWPAVLDAARQPFKSTTWHAALTVALSRPGGDLARVTRLGPGALRCGSAPPGCQVGCR
jgi:transposase